MRNSPKHCLVWPKDVSADDLVPVYRACMKLKVLTGRPYYFAMRKISYPLFSENMTDWSNTHKDTKITAVSNNTLK